MNYRNKKTDKKNLLMIAWVITVMAAVVVFAVMFSELSGLEAKTGVAGHPDETLLNNYNTDISGSTTDNVLISEKINSDINSDNTDKNDSLNSENTGKNNNANNSSSDSGNLYSSGSDNGSSDNGGIDNNASDNTGDIDNDDIIGNTADEDIQNPDIEEKPMIALTFDDGPFPTVTDRVLETLKKNNAVATFFLVGYNIDYYPDTCKKIYDYGFEIGNHTNGHKQLTKLSIDEAMQEIDYVTNALNELIPIGETLIRPPYGDYNDKLRENVKAPLICWSIDSEDWKSRDSEKIVEKVLDEAKDGAIVLMHDIYECTADAVEIIVPKLLERGYRLVTVSELLREKGIEATAGSVYR